MAKVYGIADTVEQIALKLIPSYHPELATARVKYIYVDTASKESGRPVLGKVRKISGVLQFLLEVDFLIEVALDEFNELGVEQRTALIDHLLERCYGEEDEKSGEMSWKIRKPDVQEFSSILQRHGAWNEELNGFVSIAKDVKIEDLVNDVVSASIAEETVQDS
jgi:hypothetical protein